MRPRGAALLLLLAALSSVYDTFPEYPYPVQCHWERQAQQPSRPIYLDYGVEIIGIRFFPLHQPLLRGLKVPLFITQCIGITENGLVSPHRLRHHHSKDKLDLSVAPYQLFPRVDELEIEIAAGTFLKQSQVRIMGAGGSIQDPDKTTVTIDLVPLGQKFDRTSALLISNRFLRKKVPIKSSIFGDYDVTYVHYPGLPSSVPNIPGSLGPISSNEYPFGANVHNGSHPKISSKIVAIIALSAVVFVLTCFGICIICKYKGRQKPHGIGHASNSSNTRKTGMRSSFSSMTSSTASFPSTIATCPRTVKTFSISELEKATDKFSFNRIIGEGGYGRVYRGIVEDGVEVAVKLLTGKHQNRDREFIAEVEMLSRLHHRNLVKLVGICVERSTRCLVFELVPNGSVESHLHGPDKIYGPLDFDTRMKIALGAARGLAYLHEDANPHVIHRDFKASNVLLENDFTAKVADFGLAKEASEGIEHISTQVMGTFGYVAPEYAMTGHLLVKSDVYSYGVVLLELLSGRKPVDMTQPPGCSVQSDSRGKVRCKGGGEGSRHLMGTRS
ncbi:unnamed protein product [Triticum turgidum subsp. durum]|uniref:non-specific serine/threonine protein kinase n=1 Tax=Triticum turgidum subsp. durum TaxID=4567 RepID=A0A9R1RAC6_TRITD|nr:unnamed protein product [Triticum turgidum subsp. durum]